jgi:tRNA-specific 2-thiouridylase
MSKGRILLAMSGGVDSSVAAILLQQQGYEIVGATFRTFDSIKESCIAKEKGCCSVESIFEAKHLAEKLGFEHHVIDTREEFRQTVIANFINEYLSGRTPNPCVLCNPIIKWGRLLQFADEHHCQWFATGHYARISTDNNRYFLQKGIDIQKDQTYFLWKLSQEHLKRTLFPLGALTKTEVRAIAKENGFTKIAEKTESQEICFIPNDNYRDFLKENVADFDQHIKEGKIINSEGKILGIHKGFPFYTIGQRRGLEYAAGHPVYVTRIDAGKNEVTLGEREDLYKTYLIISNVNFMKYNNLYKPMNLTCKIRYNNQGTTCVAQQVGDKLQVTFNEPVFAVTPGQSAVLYENDDIVCGGIIE